MNIAWAQTAQPAADEAARLIKRGERVAIVGRPSAGKSTVLRLLEQALPDRRVFRIAMPGQGDDAGPVALATLAAQLDRAALDVVRDLAQPWRAKLDYMLKVLKPQKTKAVVLVDDARLPRLDQPAQVFDDHATELITALADTNGIGLAFTANVAPGFRAARVAVAAHFDEATFSTALDDLRGIELLRAAVADVEAAAPALLPRSPVELRLCVGLVRSGMSVDDVVKLAGARALARTFVTRLPRHTQSALHRLAVLRLPCDRTTRDAILGEVGRGERSLWEPVALYETAEGWVLPALLVEELNGMERAGRLPPDRGRIEEAHQQAAAFHERRFADAQRRRDVPSAVRHELEVVHHFTQAGDANAVLARSLWFVEQYDALGKAVGMRGSALYRRDIGRATRPRDAGPPPAATSLLRHAISAYDRALAHDPRDAYALHYRAYNLDVLAEDAPAVEDGYRMARTEDPGRIWHHGRLVTFLVTRGRPREARAAWDEALSQLDGLRGQSWLYKELHRALALLLLHRGNLEFASQVLDDVPAPVQRDGWFPALLGRLALLRDHERDELVFPPSIPAAERWQGPRLVWGETVSRWAAGRIESVGPETVSIRYAERIGDTETFGRENYTLPHFAQVCEVARSAIPPSGTFVELLWFADAPSEQIRCFPGTDDLVLPRPFPPPDRYLNRAATRSRG